MKRRQRSQHLNVKKRSKSSKSSSTQSTTPPTLYSKITTYLSNYWSEKKLNTLCGSVEVQRILNVTTFRLMESIYSIPSNKRIYIVSSEDENNVYVFHINELDAYFSECETEGKSFVNPHDKRQIFSTECREAVARLCSLCN